MRVKVEFFGKFMGKFKKYIYQVGAKMAPPLCVYHYILQQFFFFCHKYSTLNRGEEDKITKDKKRNTNFK